MKLHKQFITIEDSGVTNRTTAGFSNDPEPWMEKAACRGADSALFYPEKGGGTTRAAKEICAECPLDSRAGCLAFGLEDRNGIFGGFTDKERRKLKASGWRKGDPVPDVKVPAKQKPPVTRRAPAVCGTRGGASRHYRLREKPCDECLKAKAIYARAYRTRRDGSQWMT